MQENHNHFSFYEKMPSSPGHDLRVGVFEFNNIKLIYSVREQYTIEEVNPVSNKSADVCYWRLMVSKGQFV